MLSALLTLALLPLALAACPCPPAPAAATVCGSNNKTYPSACDLDCTAPPGVAAAHPGPCHPEDAAPGRPISAALQSRQRARRSASEERRKWEECEERQCSATCSECGGNRDCGVMCERNCRCGCLGLQTSGLDLSRWEQCREERECMGKWSACTTGCSTQECKDRCWMDEEWCACGCLEQAATTPRPTSAATNSPAGTSPASDAVQHSMWERVLLVVCALACLCACVWVSVRARARHPVHYCNKITNVYQTEVPGAPRSRGAAAAGAGEDGAEHSMELTPYKQDCRSPP